MQSPGRGEQPSTKPPQLSSEESKNGWPISERADARNRILAFVLPLFSAVNLAILHGYLLEGSGSNLWTRCVVEALCRKGHTVQLVCQEPHPERYDCITESYR